MQVLHLVKHSVVGFTKIRPMLGCGMCRPLFRQSLQPQAYPTQIKQVPEDAQTPSHIENKGENFLHFFQLLEDRVDRLVSKYLRSQRR
jgi:hypothetical protein